MTYDLLLRDLKAGKYAPVIVLHGEEPYYIDVISDYIEEHVLDDAARAFDQVVLYGRDLPGNDIAPAIAQARGFSMMGGYKVVIVKEAQTIKKWEALSLYMDNPQPNSILVIDYKGKLDGRLSVWKGVEKKGGAMMASAKLRDNQVEKWISDYIAMRNQQLKLQGDEVRISPQITQLLAESLGTDLQMIVGALQKLIDGRPEGVQVIDAAMVERNVGISKDFNIFELRDAIIRGDVLKANRIVLHFAGSKDHPLVKELSILYDFFANLMLYHYIPQDKRVDSFVAQALGINPYAVRDYAAAARRYPAGKTFKIIGYFREIDARSKGINNPSAKDDDLWKELIYKIMH